MPSQPLGIPNPATSDEVVEGRPWWKICCAGCCLGILAVIVLAFVSFRWLTGPGPERLMRLPDSFPKSFTLYRPEEAREIMYYPASEKGRMMRIVTGPYGWFKGLVGRAPAATFGGYSATATTESLQRAIESQVSAYSDKDTVAVRWSGLQATPDDVLRFYAGSFMQVGINPQMRRDENAGLVELAGSSPRLRSSLLMVDDSKIAGIDSLTVIVEYQASKKSE